MNFLKTKQNEKTLETASIVKIKSPSMLIKLCFKNQSPLLIDHLLDNSSSILNKSYLQEFISNVKVYLQQFSTWFKLF